MTAVARVRSTFVELMPTTLEAGIVYVSVPFNTAVHLCCCGCGNRVVTPLAPTQWSLTYNGRDVTLWPSIGNWAYPCRSHYWIDEGVVEWAGNWTDRQIALGRRATRQALAAQVVRDATPTLDAAGTAPARGATAAPRWWSRLRGHQRTK